MHINLKILNQSFSKTIGPIIDFLPIGHHELHRNLVYKLVTPSKHYTLKIYLKKNKWEHELFALNFLSPRDVPTPHVIDSGIYDNCKWLIYDFYEGLTLDRVDKSLSKNEETALYHQIGKSLGNVHASRKFDFWGDYNEHGESTVAYKTYVDYFVSLSSNFLKKIQASNLEEKPFLLKMYELLLSHVCVLDDVVEPHLCHNDFSTRNILVLEKNNTYSFQCLLDFEQSLPGDRDKELIHFYLPLKENNPLQAQAFKAGYQTFLTINEEKLQEKKTLYMLFQGLNICSWAKKDAPDYYGQGLSILKNIAKPNN